MESSLLMHSQSRFSESLLDFTGDGGGFYSLLCILVFAQPKIFSAAAEVQFWHFELCDLCSVTLLISAMASLLEGRS